MVSLSRAKYVAEPYVSNNAFGDGSWASRHNSAAAARGELVRASVSRGPSVGTLRVVAVLVVFIPDGHFDGAGVVVGECHGKLVPRYSNLACAVVKCYP